MKSLLRFLSERRLSGSVMIRAAAGTGVIILAEGELAGAYTSESRDISDKPDRALALCDDPNAMIEVKAADTQKHPPLDVDEIVGGQRIARAAQSAQPTAPAPPPPAEAVNPPVTATLPVVPLEPPAAPAPPGSYPTYPPAAYPTATYPPGANQQPSYQPAPAPQPSYPPTNFAPAGYSPSYAPPATQVAPTSPPRPATPQLDWAAIVGELQAMADDALGNRARKVKDILGAADPSLAGIEGAIDQIPGISLLFVDSSRLEQLAQEMKARLKSHL
jgi:hypothetical protein